MAKVSVDQAQLDVAQVKPVRPDLISEVGYGAQVGADGVQGIALST